MGKSSEVIVALIVDHPWIREIKMRIVFIKLKDFDLSILMPGNANVALDLFRTLCYTDEQPYFLIKSEYAGIEQAFDHHIFPAGMDVFRSQQRVLCEPSGKIKNSCLLHSEHINSSFKIGRLPLSKVNVLIKSNCRGSVRLLALKESPL